MILVDTSVWSLALRRRRRDLSPAEQRIAFELRERVIDGSAGLIGAIRQELLSGIGSQETFELLKARLASIPDLPMETGTWELAAENYHLCREAGITADAIDMTICAAAHAHHASIFTTDPDFTRYSSLLPIRLYAT